VFFSTTSKLDDLTFVFLCGSIKYVFKGDFIMNETVIISNFLYDLKELQKKVKRNVPLYKNIQSIQKCLQESKKGPVCFLADNFEILEILLESSNLTSKEKGCILSKILKSNFAIIDSEPYSFIRWDKYVDDFQKFGVSYQEIPTLFKQYFLQRENFYFERPNLLGIEQGLKNLVKGEMDDAYLRGLICLKSSSKSQNFCDFLSTFRKEIMGKNKKAICKLFKTNSIFISVRSTFMNTFSLYEAEVDSIFVSYVQNGDLKQYSKEQNETFHTFMDNIMQQEEEYRLKQVLFYRAISEFMNKSNHDVLDYQHVMKLMLEKIPSSLVESFGSYMLENEKGIEKENGKKSKKELKKELLKYYNEKEPVPFDYAYFSTS